MDVGKMAGTEWVDLLPRNYRFGERRLAIVSIIQHLGE